MPLRDKDSFDPILFAWADRVHEATGLATQEHYCRLTARDFPAWDSQGVHVWSATCGEIRALEALSPALFAHPAVQFDPLGVRRAAREGAVIDYDQEREADWRLRMLLERRELEEAAA